MCRSVVVGGGGGGVELMFVDGSWKKDGGDEAI
jgi:hypothetical protein